MDNLERPFRLGYQYPHPPRPGDVVMGTNGALRIISHQAPSHWLTETFEGKRALCAADELRYNDVSVACLQKNVLPRQTSVECAVGLAFVEQYKSDATGAHYHLISQQGPVIVDPSGLHPFIRAGPFLGVMTGMKGDTIVAKVRNAATSASTETSSGLQSPMMYVPREAATIIRGYCHVETCQFQDTLLSDCPVHAHGPWTFGRWNQTEQKFVVRQVALAASFKPTMQLPGESMRRGLAKTLPPGLREKVEQLVGLPKLVIFDLDETLVQTGPLEADADGITRREPPAAHASVVPFFDAARGYSFDASTTTRFRPGIASLMQQLSQHATLGIVSRNHSSTLPLISDFLRRCDIAISFFLSVPARIKKRLDPIFYNTQLLGSRVHIYIIDNRKAVWAREYRKYVRVCGDFLRDGAQTPYRDDLRPLLADLGIPLAPSVLPPPIVRCHEGQHWTVLDPCCGLPTRPIVSTASASS